MTTPRARPLDADLRRLIDRAIAGNEPPEGAKERVSSRLAAGLFFAPLEWPIHDSSGETPAPASQSGPDAGSAEEAASTSPSGSLASASGPSATGGAGTARTAGKTLASRLISMSTGGIGAAFVAGSLVGAVIVTTASQRDRWGGTRRGTREGPWQAPVSMTSADRGELRNVEASVVANGSASVAANGSASVAANGSASVAANGSASTIEVRSAEASPLPSTSTVARPPAGSMAVTRASDLSGERAILDGARRALTAGQPQRALSLVGDHGRRFPNGVFAEEREALAVNALVEIGRYAAARDRAAQFARRFPDSMLAGSVEAALQAIPGVLPDQSDDLGHKGPRSR